MKNSSHGQKALGTHCSGQFAIGCFNRDHLPAREGAGQARHERHCSACMAEVWIERRPRAVRTLMV